jgi:Domain of unknown function (DUF4157)
MGLWKRIKEKFGIPDPPKLPPIPRKLPIEPPKLPAEAIAVLDKIGSTLTKAEDIDVMIDKARVQLTDEIRSKLGGEDAVGFMRDVDRLSAPLTPQHRAAAFDAIRRFILTGETQYLQPLAALAAGELRKARDDNWHRADPIRPEIISAMPLELHDVMRESKFMPLSKVPGEVNLPDFAIKHLKRASAITLIDLVVFKDIPDHSTTQGKHFWAHECYHLRQYKQLGVTDFCKRYIGNAIGFRAKGKTINPMEEEADLFACRHFRVPKPAYIQACPAR